MGDDSRPLWRQQTDSLTAGGLERPAGIIEEGAAEIKPDRNPMRRSNVEFRILNVELGRVSERQTRSLWLKVPHEDHDHGC